MSRARAILAGLLLAALAAGSGPAFATDIKSVDIGKNSEVWFSEDHTMPIIAFYIALPAGSADDPGGKAGLASFAASLLDEGAGTMNAAAFHGALAGHAIQFSASAERDDTVIAIVTLSENAPLAMHLLQMALTHPRFDADSIARVRTQMIQSIQQGMTQPPVAARRAFARAFFNGHPYGRPTDGEVATLSAVTAADLHGFARSHWVKGGLQIAVAGDITPAALTKLLAATFRPLPATTPPPPPNVGRLGQPGVHVLQMPVPQPTIMFGLPGIMRADPDFIPGYVANYILGGGGFSSRLTDEVRVKRGLTYGIATSLAAYRKASVMVGAVATRANAVRQTIQVVRDTMAKFAKEGPTQGELDDAKTYLTGSFPLAFASDVGIAAQLSTFQRQGLDIGYVARRNSLIQAVTLDDVKRVAGKLFDPARLTVVVAGTPVDGHPAAEVHKAPVRPTPVAPPGTPPGTAPMVHPNAPPPLHAVPAPPPAKPGAKAVPPPGTKPRT